MKRIGIVSDSHGMRGMLEQSLIKMEAGGPPRRADSLR